LNFCGFKIPLQLNPAHPFVTAKARFWQLLFVHRPLVH
jgi:hypothetical protein